MAVASATITSAILLAAPRKTQNLARIASAVGRALPAWFPLPTNVLARGVTSGMAGAGSVNGKMFVLEGPTLVLAGMRQAGLTGVAAQSLGLAVGTGVATALNATLQYSGVSFGVGSGFDLSRVRLVNTSTLIALLLANLRSSRVSGPQGPRLATGLGLGLANLVRTGFGVGAVSGNPSPVPAVGSSFSLIF